MNRQLTERTVILLSPKQKEDALTVAEECGSLGEVVRQALDLFLPLKLSQTKQDASNQEAVSATAN